MQDNLMQFYQDVQQVGKLPTAEHAQRWTAGTLKTLGLNLDGKTKRRLARALPKELADPLTDAFWLLHFRDAQLSSEDFQRFVARRSGNSDAQFARFPVLAVFASVKQMIDQDLQRDVANSLAPAVRELWEQA
jgi:uncharacterized protein (DUF2267 family)